MCAEHDDRVSPFHAFKLTAVVQSRNEEARKATAIARYVELRCLLLVLIVFKEIKCLISSCETNMFWSIVM